VWGPIITDSEIKPSSLYAPRKTFDTNFKSLVFREGLKAASRLASSFGFEPQKMRFDQDLIEEVKSLEMDPEGKIKNHTEDISSAIGEEKVKEILVLYHKKKFKILLFSVGTRMGSLVPTIESVARIYLSLRKKEILSAGDRLQITEEILMRYRKAPYTSKMANKARNLALNYFVDHLVENTLKLYTDRFNDAPDIQATAETHQRRHATIKAFGANVIDESAKKVALSAQAIMVTQSKFSDVADQQFAELFPESPDENEANKPTWRIS